MKMLGIIDWDADEIEALAVIPPSPPSPPAPVPVLAEAAVIIGRVHDPIMLAMRIQDVGPPSGSHGTTLDVNSIWKAVYDPNIQAIRGVFVTGNMAATSGVLDYGQVMKDIYDPTMRALRLQTGLVSRPATRMLDVRQILKICYHAANNSLRVKPVGGMSRSSGSALEDWNWLMKKQFSQLDGMMLVATSIAMEGPNPFFQNSFEESTWYPDLFLPDGPQKWSNFQLNPPGNLIDLDETIVHEGTKSGKFFAISSETPVSKCDVERFFFNPWFGQGHDFWCSFWVYVTGATSHENLFIYDIEDINGNYGLRLFFKSDKIVIERKNFSTTILQTNPIPFVYDAFHRIRFHCTFKSDASGVTELWIDNDNVINTTGQNLQSLQAILTQFQIGITANVTGYDQTVYIDSVKVGTRQIDVE